MASILDAGLLSIFSGFFTFLLVYAFMWGVLTWKKPFGDKNTGVYALISLTCAVFVAIIPPVRSFIQFIAPWYIALALFLFFILFITALFGLSSEKDFPKMISDSRVYTWIIIIAVVIAIFGLAFTLGQGALNSQLPEGSVPEQTSGSNGGMQVIGPGTGYQPPGTISVGSGTQYTGSASGSPQPGQPGSTATSDFQANLFNTLFHPKVLGLLVTFLLASLAIYFLSSG